MFGTAACAIARKSASTQVPSPPWDRSAFKLQYTDCPAAVRAPWLQHETPFLEKPASTGTLYLDFLLRITPDSVRTNHARAEHTGAH